jgi:hypothetical protein
VLDLAGNGLRLSRLLARHPDGCAEAFLLADGLHVGQLAVVVVEGLAEMKLAAVAGRQRVWMTITDEGREAIALGLLTRLWEIRHINAGRSRFGAFGHGLVAVCDREHGRSRHGILHVRRHLAGFTRACEPVLGCPIDQRHGSGLIAPSDTVPRARKSPARGGGQSSNRSEHREERVLGGAKIRAAQARY